MFFTDMQKTTPDADLLALVKPLPERTIRRGLMRRRIANFATDAVVQGIVVIMVIITFLVASALLRRGGAYGLSIGTLGGAAVGLGAFGMLVFRAMTRNKIIHYWHDRRALRLELRRERAFGELLVRTLFRVHDLENGDGGQVLRVLAELVDDVYSVLAATHDDIAVTLAVEAHGRYLVQHSASSAGSRWRMLKPGKSCRVNGCTFEETLEKLAPYSRAFTVETSTGYLRIGVLSDSEFRTQDEALFRQVPVCFSVIASRWHTPYKGARERLQSVI